MLNAKKINKKTVIKNKKENHSPENLKRKLSKKQNSSKQKLNGAIKYQKEKNKSLLNEYHRWMNE